MRHGLKKWSTILIIFFLFFLGLFLVLTPKFAQAHNPADIEVTHMPWGGFEVEVHHRVNDTESHYIESIIIEVDGKHYWTQNFTHQGSAYSQYYKTNVGASSRSIITVTAICNQDGEFTREFPAVNFGSDVDYTIPGFFGLGVVGILSFVLLGLLIRRKIK